MSKDWVIEHELKEIERLEHECALVGQLIVDIKQNINNFDNILLEEMIALFRKEKRDRKKKSF